MLYVWTVFGPTVCVASLLFAAAASQNENSGYFPLVWMRFGGIHAEVFGFVGFHHLLGCKEV